MNTNRLMLCCVVLLAWGCGGKTVVPLEVAKLAITAPGKAVGPGSEKLMPMTGGTLQSADGRISIEVPSGALPASQKITIQSISNETPGGKGLAYRLGPDGQVFNAPVKITFKFSKSDIAGSEVAALRVAYQDKEGRWNSIKNVVRNEASQTVTVETKHFSDWSMLAGWQLIPPVATVGAGKAVDLTVVACNSKGTGSDELAELVYTCVPDPEFFKVEDWNVNGISGGSVATGQVASSSAGTARYSAPNSPPSTNPVSVEAVARDNSGRKTLLLSSIWVDSRPPLSGTITTTQVSLANPTDILTTTANVMFKFEPSIEVYRINSGTVNSRLDVVSNGCEQHTAFAGAIGVTDGTINVGEGLYYPTGATAGTFTGTTNCTSNHMTEPLEIFSAALWWPTAAGSMLTVKPDGRLEDSMVDVETNGRKITANWSLVPVN